MYKKNNYGKNYLREILGGREYGARANEEHCCS